MCKDEYQFHRGEVEYQAAARHTVVRQDTALQIVCTMYLTAWTKCQRIRPLLLLTKINKIIDY